MGKQLKIGELKRVVNIDVIFKYAKILKNDKNTNTAQIESILNDLGTKTPSRDVLIKTKLGFILKELSNRKSLPVKTRNMARDLRCTWKDFHKSFLLLTKKDVKCDLPTNQNRYKAREFIKKSLEKLDDPPQVSALVSEIEFQFYQVLGVVNESYFKKIEKYVEFLQKNEPILLELMAKKQSAESSVRSFLMNN